MFSIFHNIKVAKTDFLCSDISEFTLFFQKNKHLSQIGVFFMTKQNLKATQISSFKIPVLRRNTVMSFIGGYTKLLCAFAYT